MKQLALLSVVPLTITGTGYALFTQNLTLGTTAAKPAYSSSQQLYVTYTKTESPSGSTTNYSFNPVTIANKGAVSVTAWQLKYDVPADVTAVTCASTVTCTRSGVTVTVNNGTGNGTINAGANTTFTMSFTSATAKYTLQNVIISGTYSTAYQTITGLTITPTKGTSTKNGSTYTYPYSFKVTNGSGTNLSGWQAVCNWSANPSTVTIDPTVNYTSTTTTITFTSITSLAAGSNITFNGRFVIKNSTWNITSCTIQGKA